LEESKMFLRETTKWKKHLEESRRVYEDGRSTEEVLTFLRQRGATKVESIRLLSELSGLTADEAKLAVHWSDTWRDVRAADDELHATIEEAAKQLLESLDQRRRRSD
jgi:ribosomal protein L7/L12